MIKNILISCLMIPAVAYAQLSVSLAPVKIAGQKVVIPLKLKNTFPEQVASARATVFLLDDQGRMVGEGSRWVIGGTKKKPPLEPNKEATYIFVVTLRKPFASMHLSARIECNRVVLESGKLADITKDVIVTKQDK